MKAFLDTSVLVACCLIRHPHHNASLPLLSALNPEDGCCSAHSLAEVYSTLTRLPGQSRMGLNEALQFLESVRERLSIIAFAEDEYWQTITGCVARGIGGGATYDAILGACAIKSKAKRIYTWNTKHFERLGPEVAGRLWTPGQKP